MNEKVTFNVTCTMNKRWVDTFAAMLNTMQHFGRIGHSEFVGIFADGDGDFNPEFEIGINYGNNTYELKRDVVTPGEDNFSSDVTMYDAG